MFKWHSEPSHDLFLPTAESCNYVITLWSLSFSALVSIHLIYVFLGSYKNEIVIYNDWHFKAIGNWSHREEQKILRKREKSFNFFYDLDV
jgi:hypothetical protein